jgi:cytochrome c biogenesis protein CcdA/thiol-disulfide isomerase/thioredoxin
MLRKLSTSLALLLIGVLFLFPVFNSVQASSTYPVAQEVAPVLVENFPDSEGDSQAHVLYFYANECTHCKAVYDEVLTPLMEKYGDQLDLRMLETGIPENYELLIATEAYFKVKPEERALPVIVVGEQILIGEEPARTSLASLLEEGIANGGIIWPSIPDFNPDALQNGTPEFTEDDECTLTDPSACETGQPIYAAYFYQVGCQACSRVDADFKYLQSKYPNLIIEEFNIYDQAALADWMSARAGRDDFHTPALFIGDQAWIGEEEITPDALLPVLKNLNDTGSENFWKNFDEDKLTNSIVDRFRSMGWMAVVFAGLVDGLNPCAFATIIFFVSYLTISGRKGREILMVGGAFALGVFLAYLAVGFGFYKVLDLFGDWLGAVGRWVYALTAVFCLVLAFFNLRDFFKARKGQIEDMELNLPKPLRMRINATIREGRKAQAYVIGAFVTGILISFLELACTGQIYLPTIIFVSSIPELRVQAIFFLFLYNLLFIVPLIVVFILAYFGTTSRDLTAFLQKHTAAVKLGMVILFLGLAIWLGVSLLS